MLGGVGDTRAQFVVTDSRHLGAIELHAAEAEHRQNSNAQHDNTHTSDPLHQRAPEQDRVRLCRYIGENRRTCGGESGHSFVPCVCDVRQCAA